MILKKFTSAQAKPTWAPVNWPTQSPVAHQKPTWSPYGHVHWDCLIMPVKCPCEICLRPCKRNQCAIQCDMCNGWIHLKCTVISPLNRGGVEDKRLEAKDKAKDTKKIRGQGQGQPFRGQTLSRPRTEMLEAKAKDQGHKRKCSPKKKKRSTQNFFKRSPQKNVSQKIFQAIHKILTIQKILLSSS